MPSDAEQFSFLPAVARVMVNGQLRGTGFYVGHQLLATCAHVIADADRPPEVAVTIQFRGGQRTWKAVVLPDYWRSPNAEDVAILKLETSPANIAPLHLGSSRDVAGHRCRTFGYPEKHPTGVHGVATVVGTNDEQGVLQIRSTEVTVGFSGAPFYDMQTHAVVGMVTAIANKDQYHRLQETGFVTPAETLLEVCDRLIFRSPETEEDLRQAIERLKRGAARCVGISKKLMDFIVAEHPHLNEYTGSDVLAEKIAEQLLNIEISRLLDLLVFGCSEFVGKTDQENVRALKSLKALAANILPAVFSHGDVRAIRTAIDADTAFVVVPANKETTVEFMMAGVDGRAARIDSLAGDRTSPRPQIQQPPEEGLSSETFKDEFLEGVLQALRIDTTWKNPVDRVNQVLERHRDSYRPMRYYYIYQAFDEPDVDRSRDSVIAQLKDTFPNLVFVKRRHPEDESREFALVHQLQEMFDLEAPAQQLTRETHMKQIEFPDKPVTIQAGPSFPEEVHVFDEAQIWALNAALAARRPLLVRGEPGVGKTQLAHAAALLLNRPLIARVVDSRTESRDLLWTFDAIQRLADAQLAGALGETDEECRQRLAVENYLEPGPLWWAFDWEDALTQARQEIPAPENWSPGTGCVVLIDEIDKAESDVPNGLLEALGAGRFTPVGRKQPVQIQGQTPLVIITTNEERVLPDAFVRRCLVLHLALPEPRDALRQLLVSRGRAHFGNVPEELLEQAAEILIQDRDAARAEQITPLPGQAEYLDLVRAVLDIAPDDADQQREALRQIQTFVLHKNAGIQP